MATKEPTRDIRDGFTFLARGMHGSLRPTLLAKDQYARGINIACRGGYAKTRPGWTPVVDLGVAGKTPFQGATRWRATSTEYIVSVFNGDVYFYDIGAGSTKHLPGTMTPGKQVFATQADALLVMADGERVVAFDIVNGIPTKVYPEGLPPANQLQPCTILHYCFGRIHSVPRLLGVTADAAPSYERYFVSGDILKPGDPMTTLGTTETASLDGGQARGLPDELGPIRGMISAQNPGQSLGLGPLLVFARDGVAAFDVSGNRASVRQPDGTLVSPGWDDKQMASVMEYGTGTDSPWSLTPSGSDVYFRGRDGFYSLRRTSQSAQSGAVEAAPISFEVQRWIDPETQLAGISGAAVDKRIFMTGVADGGAGYRGVFSLDNAVSTTMGADIAPAWDGIWTGPLFGKILEATRQGIPALYAVTTDGWIYRLDETADTDGGTSIAAQLVTRSFYSDPTQIDYLKRLEYVDLWLTEITRTSQVEIYFRPDGYPLWTRIGCPRLLTVNPAGLPQERRRLRFSCRDGQEYPENARRPGMNSQSLRVGYTYQLKIVINGCATITRLDINSTIQMEENPLQTPTDSVEQSFSIMPDADHLLDNDFDQAPPGPGLESGWVRGSADGEADVLFRAGDGMNGGMRLQIGTGAPGPLHYYAPTIQLAQGIPGAPGLQGPPGGQGPRGFTGAQGPPGRPGSGSGSGLPDGETDGNLLVWTDGEWKLLPVAMVDFRVNTTTHKLQKLLSSDLTTWVDLPDTDESQGSLDPVEFPS